jgi:hypothetical protein
VSLSEAGPAAAAAAAVDLPGSSLLEENYMRQAAKRERYIELAGLFTIVCVGCSFQAVTRGMANGTDDPHAQHQTCFCPDCFTRNLLWQMGRIRNVAKGRSC